MKFKRGAVEVQFNWIFVLIAGALIILFFVSVINKQKQISEESNSITFLKNFRSLLTSSKVSAGTVNIIDLPKKEVEFYCYPKSCTENGCDSGFSIAKTGLNQKMPIQTIFAPTFIKRNRLITWTLDWSLPYRVTNFLYLTNPQIRYIIVDNDVTDTDNLANKIFEALPEEINKEIVDNVNNVVYKNDYKIKFVYFDEPNFVPMKLRNVENDDLTALWIKRNDLNSGEIQFYKKNNTRWKELGAETYYLEEESLFGAIFSDNVDYYNCVMKKAFRKLELVTLVHYNRTNNLLNVIDISSCNAGSDYTISIDDLNTIKNKAEDLMNSFPTSVGDIDIFLSSKNSLQTSNNRIQQNSCPLIY